MLNVQADHLGLGGVDTLEQLAEVKRIVVEVARDTAVLNADDPLCLKMADYTKARHHLLRHHEPRATTLVREHIRSGGRAVVLEEGINGHMITLYDRGTHIPLLWTHLIPATLEGKALLNVQNAMFAAADRLSASAWRSRTSATACAPSTPPTSRRRGGSTCSTSTPSR